VVHCRLAVLLQCGDGKILIRGADKEDIAAA